MRKRIAALVLSALVFSLAPAAAAHADPPGARIRAAIAKAALSQVGEQEQGVNYYPIRYKISNDVIRPAEWCGVFVNWAWYKGGAPSRPPMRGSGANQGHYATYWQKWGKQHRKWRPLNKPELGAAVVYGNWSQSGHIGVVVAIRYYKGKLQVRTVEGNVHDEVVQTPWRYTTSLYGGAHLRANGFVSAA
jgi:hypothetical protein